MASKSSRPRPKNSNWPPEGQTGAYLYRNSVLGKALSKDLRVDGNCVSVSAPDVFFYTQVDGGKTRTVETESSSLPTSSNSF